MNDQGTEQASYEARVVTPVPALGSAFDCLLRCQRAFIPTASRCVSSHALYPPPHVTKDSGGKLPRDNEGHSILLQRRPMPTPQQASFVAAYPESVSVERWRL